MADTDSYICVYLRKSTMNPEKVTFFVWAALVIAEFPQLHRTHVE